jgi:chaperonin cofactor prefoldin
VRRSLAPETRRSLEVRVESLAKQNEKLLARLAALEKEVDKR